MGATFSRIKNWAPEILTNTDLNAEIDNILNNLGPAGVDDYSVTATQMKLMTNPGTTGAESLATSLSGEIERLRFVIQRLMGSSTVNWYDTPTSTITDLVAALGSGLPNYRIVSGRTTGNSSQLCALIPSGTTAALTLTASVTPLVYYIGGVQYSITANQTLTGLSLASGLNNTCSVNEPSGVVSGTVASKIWGQYGTQINVSGMNSGLSSLVGQIAGFKYGTAEYFIGYIGSTSAITNVWRGSFFTATGTAAPALTMTNGNGITLMKLAWIFANTSSSLAVTYSNPTISAIQPISPNTGDYWYDLSSTAWKTYNSTTWVAANATLIGMSLQDTAACVATRMFDSYKAVSGANTLQLSVNSNTVVQATNLNSEVNVFGTGIRYSVSRPSWDITSALDTGAAAPSTYYYLYVKESGAPLISLTIPLYRRDLRGLYYPTETWRCVGTVYSNSSTQFSTPVKSFLPSTDPTVVLGSADPYYNGAVTVSVASIQTYSDLYSAFSNDGNNQNWTAASNAWDDRGTVSVGAGLWELSGTMVFQANGTIPATQLQMQIGTASGTTPSNVNQGNGSAWVWGYISSVSSDCTTLVIPKVLIIAKNPQSFYLKGLVSSVSGTNLRTIGFGIVAKRIDSTTGSPT